MVTADAEGVRSSRISGCVSREARIHLKGLEVPKSVKGELVVARWSGDGAFQPSLFDENGLVLAPVLKGLIVFADRDRWFSGLQSAGVERLFIGEPWKDTKGLGRRMILHSGYIHFPEPFARKKGKKGRVEDREEPKPEPFWELTTVDEGFFAFKGVGVLLEEVSLQELPPMFEVVKFVA